MGIVWLVNLFVKCMYGMYGIYVVLIVIFFL